MKTLPALAGAAVLLLSSAVTFSAPHFPGLPDLATDVLGPDITYEEIKKHKEARQELEEFSKQLKAWWYSQKNQPKPIPYIKVKGKKYKLPDEFIKGYMTSNKAGNLKMDWKKIENSTLNWSWGATQ